MNYKGIYDSIISRAKGRELDGYKERHHIVPKCIRGIDKKINIVSLTAKEHLICHLLLVEIYPNEPKLRYALWSMIHLKSNKHSRVYKVSGRIYEKLKVEFGKMISKRNTQTKKSYRPKELKFEHTCESCKTVFKSADTKGRFCKECKEPRLCKCGCGKAVKTPGKLFFSGCKTRGKSYQEIYGTDTPPCGFKKNNYFGKVGD